MLHSRPAQRLHMRLGSLFGPLLLLRLMAKRVAVSTGEVLSYHTGQLQTLASGASGQLRICAFFTAHSLHQHGCGMYAGLS